MKDVQWVDIDHMSKYLDWTYDRGNFSNLPNIINWLHARNMRFVPIIDPAISSIQPKGQYPPYDLGIQSDVFIKFKGQNAIGEVCLTINVLPIASHNFSLDRSNLWRPGSVSR